MKNLLPVSLVLILIGLFLLFWESQPEYFIQEKYQQGNSQQPAPKAESFMLQLDMQNFNISGQLNYQLLAKEASFYNNGNYYSLKNPHITAYDKENNAPPWELTADEGKVFDQGKKVELLNNVRMWQIEKLNQVKEITTSELTLFPEDKTMRSDSRVQLSSQQHVTSGTGLRANFARKVFTLQKDVKGVHYVQ